LHVHQAAHLERAGEQRGLAAQLALDVAGERMRRQAAGRVPRVHARLLDVLHDAADQHLVAVAHAVDVDLDRVRQVAVEQNGRIVRNPHRFFGVLNKADLVVDDLHGSAAEHVARAHHDGVADLLGELHGLLGRARGAVGRLAQLELGQELLEALAVLGDVDRVGAGADDRHAGGGEPARQVERRLPAVLHDHAPGLFLVDDLEHVLEGERLEIQAVGGVVVGRHRLRIAVDHDGLEAIVAQRERGVHAAVVELDALPDAVRPAAQHHDLLARRGLGFALVFVSRVQVRGLGRELRRAGVDALVHRADAQLVSFLSYGLLVRIE
jgi:hypothetical protein